MIGFRSSGRLLGLRAGASDVEEIVGDDTEPDPALHPVVAPVSTAGEAVSAFMTLMRPSHPVRHFWPLRNQRFFCSRLRAALLVA